MNCTFRELFNLFRVMKIVIFLMLLSLTHLSAEVRSQNAQVNLKMKDVTVEKVIFEVEKQLKQDFFFSKKEGDSEVTRWMAAERLISSFPSEALRGPRASPGPSGPGREPPG